jgi:hypothetical protein
MVIEQALIHNIYGDADTLVASAPAGVVCIPRSWTPEAEFQLAQMMQEQGVSSISCLPSFLFRHEGGIYEIRVADLPQPWTWEAIFDAKNSLISELDIAPEAEE